MSDRDGAKPPIRAGDRVEWQPSGYEKRHGNGGQYAEADGQVVRVKGRHAVVRFDDGHEETISLGRLVWLPDEGAIAREKAWLRENPTGDHLDSWAYHDEDGT